MNAVRTVRRSLGHGAVMLAVAVAATSGCKSGSWGAKPSWWTLGGTGTTDPAKLAAAPSFSGDVTKPSATAKPYPTTSTPEGYVLANAGTAATAAAPAAAAPPAAITYGSTPPPAPAAAATIASAPAVSPATAAQPGLTPPSSPLSSIAPQVGPYAAPPTAGPPESSLPAAPAAGLAAVPAAAAGSAFSAPPAGFDPAARVADSRGGSSWPSSAPPATDPNASRYGAATGSRFSGAGNAADATPSQPAWTPSAIDAPPAAAPATPDSATPAAFVPPAGAPAAQPAITPPAVAPPTAPARRPDPGYRPGGTSSYRSSRDMLGGEGSIQPVSFESSPPPATP